MNEFNLESELTIDEIHEQSRIFKKAFKEKLAQETDEDYFDDDLQHAQEMAMMGKLNPQNKDIMYEWMNMYPERFDNFCTKLSDENRQKLINLLDL